MLRYNWYEILSLCKQNCSLALLVLESLYRGEPVAEGIKFKVILNILGKLKSEKHNILEKPEKFFSAKVHPLYKCVALRVAAKRHPLEDGIPFYAVEHSVDLKQIESNPFLKFDYEREMIYFDGGIK